MADVVTPAVRSAMMSSIRGKDTQPELVVRKGLFSRGIRFRLHSASLPGRPDLVIRKHKAVIFVHGCFWHAHSGCRYFRIPEGNHQFWIEKLGSNKKRDARSEEKLQIGGWRVAVVWECASRVDPEATIDALFEFLIGNKRFIEVSGNKSGDRLTIRFKKPNVR